MPAIIRSTVEMRHFSISTSILKLFKMLRYIYLLIIAPFAILFQFILSNVSINTMYEVSVTASTKSIYSDDMVMGKSSEPKTITMFPNCHKITEFMKQTTTDINAGMVAGIICAGFAFLLVTFGYVLWR